MSELDAARQDYEDDLREVKVLDEKGRHFLARLDAVYDPVTDKVDCETDIETA